MRKDKIFRLLILSSILGLLLSISLANAQENLGTFKQNQCIILKQTCANCTFVNVTSVVTKSDSGASIQLLGNVQMTKIGTEYNYSFCNTANLGEYTYNTLGNPDGTFVVQPVSFNVNPSGNVAPLGLFIIVIFVIYAIGFIGFFGKHPWVSALGGLAMIALGVYTINNGIDIFRTFITDVFSWITIGIGAIFVLVPLIEFIQENY